MLCYHCMHEKGNATICPFCGNENKPDPLTHHLPAGTLVGGRYILGNVLGEGGFGITYIALDTILDILVAVKEYYPYGISHRNCSIDNTVNVSEDDNNNFYQKGKQKFLNEAKIIARFRKEPSIVDVNNFFEENNTAYIVMEYLDGMDLRQYLRQNGAMSVDKTIDLLRPVFQSLEKIHAAGVIHRDISPDNIMMLENGSVKLMDFGAAREYSEESRSMSVMLKRGYAPEEQYRRNGKQGPWTDVYAICATIYRCITSKTPQDSIERLSRDELEPPSKLGVPIPPEIENTLMYGMAVRRESRCQSMAELDHLLSGTQQHKPFDSKEYYRTILADKPDCEKTPSDLPKKKTGRRIPIIIASVAVVLIVAITVLIVIDPFSGRSVDSSHETNEAPSTAPSPTEAPASLTYIPATKISVKEDSEKAKEFENCVNYVIDHIDSSAYHFYNNDERSTVLNSDELYRIDDKQEFKTDFDINKSPFYIFKQQITINGKNYLLDDMTLKDLLDNDWKYVSGTDLPQANNADSQNVYLSLDGKHMMTNIADTKDDPSTGIVKNIIVSTKEDSLGGPTPIEYGGDERFNLQDTDISAYNKYMPNRISISTEDGHPTVRYTYNTISMEVLFLIFSYDSVTDSCTLETVFLSFNNT